MARMGKRRDSEIHFVSVSSAVRFLRSFTTRFQSSLNSLKFRSSATCRLDAVFQVRYSYYFVRLVDGKVESYGPETRRNPVTDSNPPLKK